MDNFIIAAGGTGAMCARAFIYMAAAGCANNDDTYHILLMDKDKQSDAVTACENLLSDYNLMRAQMGLKAGTQTFPAIKVHKWNFTEEIVDEYVKQTHNSAASLSTLTLNKLLNPQSDPQMGQILKTMYTTEELDTDLEKGFYGHPNIGAPVFDYVRERFLSEHVRKANGSVQDNTFMIDLHAALTQGIVHVYLMGSLFGGTGATVIPNVILALRSLKNSAGTPYGMTNLVLGTSVIMPYFKLPICNSDNVEMLSRVAPSDVKFAGQTRDALSYYHESHLLDNVMNMLLLGCSNLDVTSELYARGGVQSQHFHIVILLAAAAANRFFADSLGSMAGNTENLPVRPLGELLVWKAAPNSTADYNSLSEGELDLSGEYQKLVKFLRFSVVVGYYMRLRFEADPVTMKDWNEVLGTCRQFTRSDGSKLDAKPAKEDIEEYYKAPVEKAGAICKGFIQFFYDVALSGYDWSGYHVKNKVPAKMENGVQYYNYSVSDATELNAAAGFSNRWVDFANLADLKDLLEATKLDGIMNQKTLNGICSYLMRDAGMGRPGVTETQYPNHIAGIYEDTLKALKLQKTIFGTIKRDDVYFCEIYDQLLKSV